MKQKLGKERRTGDHGKWICGVKTLLQKPGCIVYSVGSNGLTGQLHMAWLSLHAAFHTCSLESSQQLLQAELHRCSNQCLHACRV